MRIERASRSLRVVGVFGGEGRCRVRKRVCRWSRGRGNILGRDEAVSGDKMYNSGYLAFSRGGFEN
jgi:hypothetical protein